VPGGLILSSNHPAAMRRYACSPGFRHIPTVGLSGAREPRRTPSELRCRPGDLEADAQTIDDASRLVGGASHRRDLPRLLDRPGAALIVIDGDGFACADNGAVLLLAARTEAAATDLLWGAMLSGPRGATGRSQVHLGRERVGDRRRPGGGPVAHRLRPDLRTRRHRADGTISAQRTVPVSHHPCRQRLPRASCG